MAGLPLTCCPTVLHSRLDAQVFRVLLLRRLWLPLPPLRTHASVAVLSTSLATTVHRAPMWECWGRRGFELESARLVRDFDIALPDRADERRIEVIADGLPLFHGAQLVYRHHPRVTCEQGRWSRTPDA